MRLHRVCMEWSNTFPPLLAEASQQTAIYIYTCTQLATRPPYGHHLAKGCSYPALLADSYKYSRTPYVRGVRCAAGFIAGAAARRPAASQVGLPASLAGLAPPNAATAAATLPRLVRSASPLLLRSAAVAGPASGCPAVATAASSSELAGSLSAAASSSLPRAASCRRPPSGAGVGSPTSSAPGTDSAEPPAPAPLAPAPPLGAPAALPGRRSAAGGSDSNGTAALPAVSGPGLSSASAARSPASEMASK